MHDNYFSQITSNSQIDWLVVGQLNNNDNTTSWIKRWMEKVLGNFPDRLGDFGSRYDRYPLQEYCWFHVRWRTENEKDNSVKASFLSLPFGGRWFFTWSSLYPWQFWVAVEGSHWIVLIRVLDHVLWHDSVHVVDNKLVLTTEISLQDMGWSKCCQKWRTLG